MVGQEVSVMNKITAFKECTMNNNEFDFHIPEFTIDTPSEINEKIFPGALGEDKLDWGQSHISLRKIWQETKGEAINVAILDSGIIENEEFNYAVKAKKNFTKIGDVDDTIDTNGHGTFVAGIIGARLNNRSIVGVAPECNLYIAKVTEGRNAPVEYVARALEWCIEKKVDLINLSLENGRYVCKIHQLIKDFTYGYSNGKPGFVICSGGNKNKITYPAKYSETLAVAKIDRGLTSSSGASGPEIDFAAPGIRVSSLNELGREETRSGSSFAAPFITGIVALILSKHRSSKYPNLSPIANISELKTHLREMSKDLGPQDKDPFFGHGFPENWIFESEEFIKALNTSDLTESGLVKLVNFLTIKE